MQMGGGGVVLSFDLQPGALGWLKANDRDISLVTQAYRDHAPNTLRLHSFQDAVFVPDVMTGYTIPAEDESHAVLQTLDGSVRVAVWPDRLKLTAGALSVTVGPSTIDFEGYANFPDGLSVAGIDFETHAHTAVQSGGDTSGGPV